MQTGTVTIADQGTDSSALEIKENTIIGIVLPTMTAGTITIQGSADGVNFSNVWKEDWSGVLSSASTTGGICLFAGMKYPFRWIKIVSGGTQQALRTITICSKR